MVRPPRDVYQGGQSTFVPEGPSEAGRSALVVALDLASAAALARVICGAARDAFRFMTSNHFKGKDNYLGFKTHTYKDANTRTDSHTHRHTHAHTHKHKHTHTHTDTLTHAHTCAHTQIHTEKRTEAHTHIYIYIYIYIYICASPAAPPVPPPPPRVGVMTICKRNEILMIFQK